MIVLYNISINTYRIYKKFKIFNKIKLLFYPKVIKYFGVLVKNVSFIYEIRDFYGIKEIFISLNPK